MSGPFPYDPNSQAGPASLPTGTPAPGALGIKERRSWKTSYVAVGLFVALMLGLFVGHANAPAGGASSTGGGNYQTPPPPANNSGSTTTLPGSSSTTTQPGGHGSTTTTSTTQPGGHGTTTTTTPGSLGTEQYLLPQVETHGPWASPSFTVKGGTWDIGWAFQCSSTLPSIPPFSVFIVVKGSTGPETLAIRSANSAGQGVSPETKSGVLGLQIEAEPSCTWAVKVTGYGTPAA